MEDTSKQMPHLYLDMDGVQADFFGAWAAMHDVGNYKEIPDTEMSINELATSSPLEVYKFFRELKPLQGGNKIVQWLNQNNIPYTILSAPLRGPYAVASVEAKKDWLDEHNPGASKNAIFASNKHKYALNGKEPNVLVVITQEDPETGDMIIPLPPQLLRQLGWKEGDNIDFQIDDKGKVIIKKL